MDWPFVDGPRTACFTSAAVLERGHPVCLVFRDDEDGSFSFLPWEGAPEDTGEARLIALENALALDASIAEVADLAPGWVAFRKGPGQPWGKRQQGT